MEDTKSPELYCVWGGGKFGIQSCVLERLCGLTGRRHLIRHPAGVTRRMTPSPRGEGLERAADSRPYGGGRDARMPLSVTSASRRDSSPRRGSQERRHLRRGRRVHIPTPVCRRAMLGATGQPLRQGGEGRSGSRSLHHPADRPFRQGGREDCRKTTPHPSSALRGMADATFSSRRRLGAG